MSELTPEEIQAARQARYYESGINWGSSQEDL